MQRATSNINNSTASNLNSSQNSQSANAGTNLSNQNNSNSLLKDLIRILVIRELISRRNHRRLPYSQPYYGNQFMPSYMF